jgi:hypothetical protein
VWGVEGELVLLDIRSLKFKNGELQVGGGSEGGRGELEALYLYT